MTAVILGMTRAFGETLAVRMVIGGIEMSGRTLELARLLSFSPTWFSHSLTGLPMPFG